MPKPADHTNPQKKNLLDRLRAYKPTPGVYASAFCVGASLASAVAAPGPLIPEAIPAALMSLAAAIGINQMASAIGNMGAFTAKTEDELTAEFTGRVDAYLRAGGDPGELRKVLIQFDALEAARAAWGDAGDDRWQRLTAELAAMPDLIAGKTAQAVMGELRPEFAAQAGQLAYIVQLLEGGREGQSARPTVFISYARKDFADGGRDPDCLVQRLYRALRDEGFTPWLDLHDLPSRGVPFPAELAQAVEQAGRFIAICGPNYPASEWCRAERAHAHKMCIPVTPVLAGGDFATSLTPDIRDLNALDLRGDFDAAWPELLKRLQEDALPGPFRRDPPLPPTGALPRTEKVTRIKTALRPDDHRLVVVEGRAAITAVHAPGGLGKTVLAALTARDCEVRRACPDGVAWITVGPRLSVEGLRARVGEAFGLTGADAGNPAQLTALLQGKRALIVFDDVWECGPVEACLIQGPGLRYLITTRLSTLAGDLSLPQGNRVQIDYLTPDEGVALVARRLELDPETDYPHKETHRAIAEALGGHTHAIALAARRLDKDRDGPDYAPILLERIKQRKEQNPFAALNVGEDRERNLEVSLSLSYDALGPEPDAAPNEEVRARRTAHRAELQRCFRALVAFAENGSFDEEALVTVWAAADPHYAHDALMELVALGLVERPSASEDALAEANSADRYALHGLLRLYAKALSTEEEIITAERRHTTYYVTNTAQLSLEDQPQLKAAYDRSPLFPSDSRITTLFVSAYSKLEEFNLLISASSSG